MVAATGDKCFVSLLVIWQPRAARFSESQDAVGRFRSNFFAMSYSHHLTR